MSDLEPPDLPDLPPTLDEEHTERLLAELSATRASAGPLDAVRQLPTAVRIAIAISLCLALLTTSTWVQGLRPDLGAASSQLFGPLLILATAGTLSLAFAFRPIHKPTPHPGRRTAIAGAGLVLAVASASIPGLWPGVFLPDHLVRAADTACATGAATTGIVIVTLFLALDRHAGTRVFSALALISTSTLLAFVVQTVHCPAIDPHHLLGSHAMMAAIAGLLAVRWAMRGSGSARG